jgi:predicted RNA binding protein YcfA (HicA-like mRNA interferase family)
VSPASEFPSRTGRQLRRVLERKPLGYRTVRQKGSHRRMVAPGRPAITFGFHDKASVRPVMVRKVLCVDVGLSEAEALTTLRRR